MAERYRTRTLTRLMVTALFFLSGYVPRRLLATERPRTRRRRVPRTIR